MILFCGWFVGTMVLWRDEERDVSLAPAEQQVLALCERLADAEVMHDERTIDRILHDQFLFTDEDGKTIGKAEFLKLTRLLHARSQELFLISPRIIGSKAFVQGTVRILPRSGRDGPIAYQFFASFELFNGQWKAVEQRIDLPLRSDVLDAATEQVAA